MIQNKELYSYIINSIEVMNKSLIVNEQNTVKLFSYVYNNQNNIYNNVNDIHNAHNKLKQNLNNIKNTITEFNNTVNDLNNRIESLEKFVNEQKNMIITVPIIVKDKEHKTKIDIKQILSNVSDKIVNIYNRFYKFVFKKQIDKKLKKEQELKEKLLQKERELEKKRKKQRIKEILNTCNK